MKDLVYDVWVNKINFLLPKSYSGWEIWHNRMDAGDDLPYHIDVDEKADKMSTPYLSCVIYLGSNKSIKGGSLNLNATSAEHSIKPEKTPLIVPFRYNRVIIFKACVHWVSPVRELPSSDDPRVSLSCPLWEEAIEPIAKHGEHHTEVSWLPKKT